MSKRTSGTFYDTMSVMSVLASNRDGMTRGEIQKHMTYLTVGQVGRIMDTLKDCGFVWGDPQKHGGTGKIVYKMTEAAAIFCASIAREYTEKN